MRVTGLVRDGLAGFFLGGGVLHIILRNLSYHIYMYVSMYHVVVLHVICPILCSRKANLYVRQ